MANQLILASLVAKNIPVKSQPPNRNQCIINQINLNLVQTFDGSQLNLTQVTRGIP